MYACQIAANETVPTDIGTWVSIKNIVDTLAASVAKVSFRDHPD